MFTINHRDTGNFPGGSWRRKIREAKEKKEN
jgi:hypothetical protein